MNEENLNAPCVIRQSEGRRCGGVSGREQLGRPPGSSAGATNDKYPGGRAPGHVVPARHGQLVGLLPRPGSEGVAGGPRHAAPAPCSSCATRGPARLETSVHHEKRCKACMSNCNNANLNIEHSSCQL